MNRIALATALFFAAAPAWAQPQQSLEQQIDSGEATVNRITLSFGSTIAQQATQIATLQAKAKTDAETIATLNKQNAVPVTCPAGLTPWTRTDDKGTLTRGCEATKVDAPPAGGKGAPDSHQAQPKVSP